MNIVFLFFLTMGVGCNKVELQENNPSKIILGKWEIVEIDNKPVQDITGYTEYLPDSVLREYEYETGTYYIKKYCIDTLLHEFIYVPQEGHYLLFFDYNYDFTNNNNVMHLNYVNFYATHNRFTYKRIE